MNEYKNKKIVIDVTRVEENEEDIQRELSILEKLMFLDGIVFFSRHDDDGPHHPKYQMFPFVNCNDLFYLGAADAEQIKTYGEAEEVIELHDLFGPIGVNAWAADKRGEKPVVHRGTDLTTSPKYIAALDYLKTKREKCHG